MIISHPNFEEIILISLKTLSQSNKKASYGNLIMKAFKLFPKQISLTDHPKYPDSLKLDRPIRTLRNEGLITGSPITYFKLTKNGNLAAIALIKQAKSSKYFRQTQPTSRSPVFKRLDKISKSQHFKEFLKNKNKFFPNEMRIRELLGFTLETPTEKMLSELDYILKTSTYYSNKKVISFLEVYSKYVKSLIK